MKDVIVSIRLPSSLTKELKDLAKANHYVDLSEQLRDVIRQKTITYLEPKIQPQKTDEKEQLVKELTSLIEKLRKQ